MPGVSGLELCRLVRSDPRWSQLPVVFLSGSHDADAVRRVYAAGADDFVSKPVAGPELQARIANRLERARLHRLLAETDPLTGLANRRRLERDLNRLQLLADRYHSDLSLAVVDVDHFKRVNDRYGHASGDEVLRRLAGHLQAAFRGEDAVARVGGEEFVVAMLGMRREDAVERLGGVLQSFRDTPQEMGGELVTVAASAGVAQHDRDGVGFEALYRAADGALRVAKASGRGRVLPAGAHLPRDADEADAAVVDDGEALAELLRHTLTTAGYRCVVLPDGLPAADRPTAGPPRAGRGVARRRPARARGVRGSARSVRDRWRAAHTRDRDDRALDGKRCPRPRPGPDGDRSRGVAGRAGDLMSATTGSRADQPLPLGLEAVISARLCSELSRCWRSNGGNWM